MNPNPYEPSQIDSAIRTQPPILAALVGEDGGMSIDFEICRDDMVTFALFHNRNSPALRRQVRLALIAVTLIFMVVLAIVVSFAINAPEFWVIAVGIAIALVIVLPFFGRIQEWRLKNALQRMYGEGRNLLLIGPRRVGLSPQFLNNSSAYSQSVTRWIAIEKIVVSKDAVYIYISSVSSVVVPRRAFSSDEHFQSFVHTAQEFHAQALAAENPLRTAV